MPQVATATTTTLFAAAAFTAAALDTEALLWEIGMAIIGAGLSTLIIPLAQGKSGRYRLTQYLGFISLAVILAIILHRLGDAVPITTISSIDGIIVILWQIDNDLRCLFIGYFLPTIIYMLPGRRRLETLLRGGKAK